MDSELRGCLRIDAPEWYRRQDFRDFLNGKREGQENRSPAMWHHRGEEPDEMSDVFVTYDNGEGSDAEGIIPDDIWDAICAGRGQARVRGRHRVDQQHRTQPALGQEAKMGSQDDD